METAATVSVTDTWLKFEPSSSHLYCWWLPSPFLCQLGWWWSWTHSSSLGGRLGWNRPPLSFWCATPMAQKQFPFWSLTRCIEDLNRDWKNLLYLLQSLTNFQLCNDGRAAWGKSPFSTEHDMPLLAVFRAWVPWVSSLVVHLSTIFKNYLETQILWLPPCIIFGKWHQHISSRDWLLAGLRDPTKGDGPQLARDLLALERGVWSIPSGCGMGIRCDSLRLGGDLCRNPLVFANLKLEVGKNS